MTRSTVRRMVRSLPPVRWMAPADGAAHAHGRAPVTLTLCGLPAVPERLAHPPRYRCPRCLAAVGFLPADGPEGAA
jgi:hypothetical protein